MSFLRNEECEVRHRFDDYFSLSVECRYIFEIYFSIIICSVCVLIKMYCFKNILFLFFVLVTVDSDCSLSKELQAEIASYADEVEAIINATTIKSFKDVTYNELAKFIDTFGNRRVGSQRLEDAIDYMLELSKNNSLENVHGEEVDVPNWIRYISKLCCHKTLISIYCTIDIF